MSTVAFIPWDIYPYRKGKNRCEGQCKAGGAGHKGPHRCTFIAKINCEGKWYCMTHVRQWLRQKNKGY